jgi:hypothetical protein
MAGYACVLFAFALIVLLGTGLVAPPVDATATGLGALLFGLLPSVFGALALFLLGLWLLKGGRRP